MLDSKWRAIAVTPSLVATERQVISRLAGRARGAIG